MARTTALKVVIGLTSSMVVPVMTSCMGAKGGTASMAVPVMINCRVVEIGTGYMAVPVMMNCTGGGDDRLYGGAGRDRFYFESEDGLDRIHDLDIGDVLVFYDLAPSSLVHKDDGKNCAISYGDGDHLILSGDGHPEFRLGTLADLYDSAYLKQERIDPNSRLVNGNDVEDLILVVAEYSFVGSD